MHRHNLINKRLTYGHVSRKQILNPQVQHESRPSARPIQRRRVASGSNMALVYALLLYLLHVLYSVCVFLYNFWRRRPRPLPLLAKRFKHPKHLSLLVVDNARCTPEDNRRAYLESVRDVSRWCLSVGIKKLSVYDSNGMFA